CGVARHLYRFCHRSSYYAGIVAASALEVSKRSKNALSNMKDLRINLAPTLRRCTNGSESLGPFGVTKVCRLMPFSTAVPKAPLPHTNPGYTLTPVAGETGATASVPAGAVWIVYVDEAACRVATRYAVVAFTCVM